jgi:hypothetical protein
MKVNVFMIPEGEKKQSWRLDCIAMFFLVLCALRLCGGLDSCLDIHLWDETFYLSKGINLLRSGPPHAVWGPSYCSYYWLLSLFQPDPVALYYTNYVALSVISVTALFALLRRLSVPTGPSFLLVFLYLVSSANFTITVRANAFAFILTAVSFLLSTYFSSFPAKCFVMSLGTLVAAYARPELFICSAFLALTTVVCVFIPRFLIGWRIRTATVVTLALAGGTAAYFLGLPVGGGRVWHAFSQHFALHYAVWTGLSIDPMLNNEMIVRPIFGDSNTILQAFLTNPAQFMKHMASNALGLPQAMADSLLSRSMFFRIAEVAGSVILIVSCLIRRGALLGCAARLREQYFLGFVVVVFLVPALSAALLIFPQDRLLIVPVAFLVLLVAVCVFQGRVRLKPWQAVALGCAFTYITPVCLAFQPSSRFWPPAVVCPHGCSLPNLKTVRFLSGLERTRCLRLLSLDGYYHVYLNKNDKTVIGRDKNLEEPFGRYLQRNHINGVVLSRMLETHPQFSPDREFKRFVTDPAGFGFKRYQVPGTDRAVFLATDIAG